MGKISVLWVMTVLSPFVCRGQTPYTYISRIPQRTDAYFQTFTYLGEQRELLTVSTFLTDSTLYRIDTYRIAGPPYAQRIPLDDRLVVLREGPTKVMYPNGQVYLSCLYRVNQLDGPFLLYYNDGTLKRRELYKNGSLRQSHCYTPQGTEQPCSALYQPIMFNGSYKVLQRYLEKNIQPVLDRTGAVDAQVQLTINEVGQLTNIEVNSYSKANDEDLITSIRTVIQAIPQQVPNQQNWQPATMDGVPLTEVQRFFITKRKGFTYVNMPLSTPN
ncbi:toxin-antitoxin system YwqK family antitoxin [Spirosoma oryzae]|nr:hypothetical protein [Spirosoma oryzae]